jgi:pimeloyl-ACP methyl ester carboxylesterase
MDICQDVDFESDGDKCAAWLYLPEHSAPSESASERAHPVPAIVMAHGLGGVRMARLDAYAERFCAAGYACLVFDYRHFGASGGSPRQLVDIDKQLADWRAAVGYARSRAEIDPQRIALWGTSFGGGHVLATAAADKAIRAVIAQCPFTDGVASTRVIDPVSLLCLLPAAVVDIVCAALGRAPVTVPTVGSPHSVALLTAPDCLDGYLRLAALAPEFRNEIAARFLFAVGRYRPGRRVRDITSPVFFAICEKDSVAPAGASQKHAATAPRGETRLYPYGHFDIYFGEPFEQVVSDQLDFLRRHVPTN